MNRPPQDQDPDDRDSSGRLIGLFAEACARMAGAERDAFLAEACADDPPLRDQLQSLLLAHDEAGDFLRQQEQTILSKEPLSEGPGDRIGRYKLLQPIGEGGSGVVYMAEQMEPVRRRVALKILKLGMDTRQVIARFEAERQALAMMDHPNIASVLDAGATDQGRPYFVMELVRGTRITSYCDEHKLSTEDRLKLFMQVCHAIQHAHQKGVIHRDIKPSNILVTVIDGVATPKVIDFGIAKAIAQPLTEKTFFTAFEQFVGTPAYMSPEQAGKHGTDIDTRADIYALGVLLYELLTGTTPFNAKDLLIAGLDEMRRIIREQDPVSPSKRVEALTRTDLTNAASHRHTESGKLPSLLRGDLDWIVMKCLDKDRARRYETSNGLAMDILAHLNREPVSASPPSAAYRFRKFASRNRAVLMTMLLVSAALVIGTVASTWQAIRAREAERVAEVSRQNEAWQRREAEANLNKARQAVNDSFTKISESALLDAPGLQPLRRSLLEGARSYYQGFLEQSRNDPKLQGDVAAARLRLSVIYISLDRTDEAGDELLAGLEAVERLNARNPGDPDLARQVAGFFRISGRMLARTRGPVDPMKAHDTLKKAVSIWERFAKDHPSMPELRSDLAGLYLITGSLLQSLDRPRGLAAFSKAHEITTKLVIDYPDNVLYHDLYVLACQNYGWSLGMGGRIRDREKFVRETISHLEELVRRSPAQTQMQLSLARIHLDLAETLRDIAPEHAETSLRRAIGLIEHLMRTPGATAKTRHFLYIGYHRLSKLLQKAGRDEEAVRMEELSLPINEKLVIEFPDTPEFHLDLADRYQLQAERIVATQPLAARQVLRQAHDIRSRIAMQLPERSQLLVDLSRCRLLLAAYLREAGEIRELEELLRDATLPPQRTDSLTEFSFYWQDLAKNHNKLGIFLRNEGRDAEAARELERAREIWRTHPDPKLAARRRTAEAQTGESALYQWSDVAGFYFDAGEWENCLEAIRLKRQVAAAQGGGAYAWDGFIEAMAHWQLRHDREARDSFCLSIASMEQVQSVAVLSRQQEAALLLALPDPGPRVSRGFTLMKKGEANSQRGEAEQALACYREAAGSYASLAGDFPEVTVYRLRTMDLYSRLHHGMGAGDPRRADTFPLLRDALRGLINHYRSSSQPQKTAEPEQMLRELEEAEALRMKGP